MDINKTLCKQCEHCEDFLYERTGKTGNIIKFQYCNGNKDLVKLSNWYIQKDGYAYSTKELYGKKRFFHTFFKQDQTKVIDHVDGDRLDNRLRKLREITPLCNNQNYHDINRTSKFPGVYFDRKNNGWRSATKIGKHGKRKNLGIYPTELEAYDAYVTDLRATGRTVNTQVEVYHEYKEWLSEKSQTKLIV